MTVCYFILSLAAARDAVRRDGRVEQHDLHVAVDEGGRSGQDRGVFDAFNYDSEPPTVVRAAKEGTTPGAALTPLTPLSPVKPLKNLTPLTPLTAEPTAPSAEQLRAAVHAVYASLPPGRINVPQFRGRVEAQLGLQPGALEGKTAEIEVLVEQETEQLKEQALKAAVNAVYATLKGQISVPQFRGRVEAKLRLQPGALEGKTAEIRALVEQEQARIEEEARAEEARRDHYHQHSIGYGDPDRGPRREWQSRHAPF